MPSEPDPQITHIQVEPTTRCNLECTSCIKPVYRDKWIECHMSPDRLDTVLANSPGVSSVHLQGWGEPLLHPDLPAMIRVCKARGLVVSFTTNGSFMDRGLADRLIEAGLDAITFSMAGGGEVTQDAVRGRGSFRRLNASVALFLDRRATAGESGRIKVAISYLLTPKSVAELPRVVGWCRRSSIDQLATVHLTQAVHPGQEALQFFPSALTLSQKWVRFFSNFRALGRSSFCFSLRPFSPEPLPVCDKNPGGTCFVSVDGSVSPCVFLNPPVAGGIAWKKGNETAVQAPVVFGNLMDQGLDAVYRGEEYAAFRRAFTERTALYARALSTVGYGMEGTEQLARARGKIARGFEAHPPPSPCRFCRKLEGF
ncbi:MAG: radical SAM protein [Desulfobacter sp.]|nr:MAG: radical SAM protein [Desulfobacter sp.]